MTEQQSESSQIEQQSGTEEGAIVAERVSSVALDGLVEKVRDEAIEGIPVVRNQADIVRNLMNGGGLRRFTSRNH